MVAISADCGGNCFMMAAATMLFFSERDVCFRLDKKKEKKKICNAFIFLSFDFQHFTFQGLTIFLLYVVNIKMTAKREWNQHKRSNISSMLIC